MIVVFVLSKVVASSLLLAFSYTKRKYCLCIQSLKQVYAIKCPPYLPIDGISLPFQVNLHVPPLNLQINFCFVCPYSSWSDKGSPYIPILNVFYARGEFIRLSNLLERMVLGMPSPNKIILKKGQS